MSMVVINQQTHLVVKQGSPFFRISQALHRSSQLDRLHRKRPGGPAGRRVAIRKRLMNYLDGPWS